MYNLEHGGFVEKICLFCPLYCWIQHQVQVPTNFCCDVRCDDTVFGQPVTNLNLSSFFLLIIWHWQAYI